MKWAVLLLCAVSTSMAADILVVVTNLPQPGLPFEISHKPPEDRPKIDGPRTNWLTSAVQINVRYIGSSWTNASDVKSFISGLAKFDGVHISTGPTWAQYEGLPHIEGVIIYQTGVQGRFILWDWMGCFQDSEHRWWCMTFQNYWKDYRAKRGQPQPKPDGDGLKPAP